MITGKAKKKEVIRESGQTTGSDVAAKEKLASEPSSKVAEGDESKPAAATAPPALDIWVPPKKRRRKQNTEEEETYPVPPNVIHIVTRPRTYVNHTYRDFSSVPLSDGSTKIEIPQEVSQMSFHLKVYHLLSTTEEQSTSSIEWCTHGRAFRIVQVDRLEQRLGAYFGHNRWSKFRKLLLDHGFKLITEGRDADCYYSEFLLRGLPHLTQYAPQPVDRRKLLPDPENEPDFYEISQLFPLPDDSTNKLEEEARAALAKRGIFVGTDASSVPSLPSRFSTVSASAMQLPTSNFHPSSLFPPLYTLATTTLSAITANRLSADVGMRDMSAVAANRLSAVARMQEMNNNLLHRIGSSDLPLLSYGQIGIGDRLTNVGSNPITLRTTDPSIQNYQHDTAFERLQSSLRISQILAEQESRDRMSAYLRYLNSREGDDGNAHHNNPFNEHKQP